VPYPCEHVCTQIGCYNIRSRPLRPEPRRNRRVLSKPPRFRDRRLRRWTLASRVGAGTGAARRTVTARLRSPSRLRTCNLTRESF